MKKHESMLCIKGLLGVIVIVACCVPFPQTAAQTAPKTLDQGSKWNNKTRDEFYSQDQGSRLIPLKWINALKQPNGEPFLAANLDRYGYLPNPASKNGLPVGFTTNSGNNTTYLGMTCAACHTRQIDVAGTSYRIDGGPAVTDLQSFFGDLNTAVARVLTDDAAFNQFAIDVLGGTPTAIAKTKLRDEVAAWFLPNDAIVKRSLPVDSPWGPARADAISLIFNRVSGLDIGPPPTHMIPENIKLADVPVRYPFLWNAWRQDFTQWPGFAPNGNKLFGLTRNVGGVIGVFAEFHPFKDRLKLLKVNYSRNNSANLHGLIKLEELIMQLGPPKWPWPLDQALAAKGALVYKQKDAANGNQSCEGCHGIKPGKFRFTLHGTWATPILDVGTDSREINLLCSEVETGVLEGARILGIVNTPLKAVDSAKSVLVLSVGGSILQNYLTLGLGLPGKKEGGSDQLKDTLPPKSAAALNNPALCSPAATTSAPYPYESRVMQGIWAAAPYLHNGSVPTLTELLTPDAQRVSEFMVGPAYDIEKVGLAAQQTKFNYTLKTTDCTARNSGNS
ncbi:MAG: di-heme-cytochrome C peroxidase, partial [Pyrinomonadaceae bacterium]|nr:di-heme-cytochrome C peroxidase [Pyrinomonadaceae bacterium]